MGLRLKGQIAGARSSLWGLGERSGECFGVGVAGSGLGACWEDCAEKVWGQGLMSQR